jgi:hypothetical protein
VIVILFADKIEIACQQEVVLQFTGRAQRNVQETVKFAVPALAASFGDIGGYRRGASTCLAGQAVHLLLRERACDSIRGQGQPMGLMPNLQISEVFISAAPFTG